MDVSHSIGKRSSGMSILVKDGIRKINVGQQGKVIVKFVDTIGVIVGIVHIGERSRGVSISFCVVDIQVWRC